MIKTPFLPRFSSVMAVLLVLSAGGCVTTETNRGYTFEEEKLSQIQTYSSKEDVINVLGTPSTLNDYGSEIWYYVGKEEESIAFLTPKVKKLQVVAISFDQDNLVSEVKTYSEDDAREIALINETTPTFGKTQNMFQQLLSNVGRFSDRNIDYSSQ